MHLLIEFGMRLTIYQQIFRTEETLQLHFMNHDIVLKLVFLKAMWVF